MNFHGPANLVSLGDTPFRRFVSEVFLLFIFFTNKVFIITIFLFVQSFKICFYWLASLWYSVLSTFSLFLFHLICRAIFSFIRPFVPFSYSICFNLFLLKIIVYFLITTGGLRLAPWTMWFIGNIISKDMKHNIYLSVK